MRVTNACRTHGVTLRSEWVLLKIPCQITAIEFGGPQTSTSGFPQELQSEKTIDSRVRSLDSIIGYLLVVILRR